MLTTGRGSGGRGTCWGSGSQPTPRRRCVHFWYSEPTEIYGVFVLLLNRLSVWVPGTGPGAGVCVQISFLSFCHGGVDVTQQQFIQWIWFGLRDAVYRCLVGAPMNGWPMAQPPLVLPRAAWLTFFKILFENVLLNIELLKLFPADGLAL